MRRERRGPLKRITEILIRCRTAQKPTVLMRAARIEYKEFTEYTDLLLRQGLIELIPHIQGKTKVLYRTTIEGDKFLDNALMCFAWIEDDYIKKIDRGIKRAFSSV